jgi:hypothetical protein
MRQWTLRSEQTKPSSSRYDDAIREFLVHLTHKLNEFGIVHEAEEYNGVWGTGNWSAEGRIFTRASAVSHDILNQVLARAYLGLLVPGGGD